MAGLKKMLSLNGKKKIDLNQFSSSLFIKPKQSNEKNII